MHGNCSYVVQNTCPEQSQSPITKSLKRYLAVKPTRLTLPPALMFKLGFSQAEYNSVFKIKLYNK